MRTTSGFVLRKYDIGEADRVYVIYTEDYGKKNLFCKGARKIQSKLSPNLAEFAEVSLEFVKGKRYEKIIGAQIGKSFFSVRNDLRKIAIGSFVMDVVDNLIKPEHPDREVYNLIKKAMQIIDEHKDIKKAYFSANIFIWKTLILLGYKPELGKCAKCGRKLEEPYFDKLRCEFVCGDCFWIAGTGNQDGLYLRKPHPRPLLKGEGAVRSSSIEYLKGNPLPEVHFEEIILIIKSFMRLHLEKVLKSEVWIDKLF